MAGAFQAVGQRCLAPGDIGLTPRQSGLAVGLVVLYGAKRGSGLGKGPGRGGRGTFDTVRPFGCVVVWTHDRDRRVLSS